MPTKLTDKSPRDRLLHAANELFYDEGVHTVGIDRVIERAGVAKASLYSTFGSKERAGARVSRGNASSRAEAARSTDRIAKHRTPREKILAVFELIGEISLEPNFRGCAFVNVSAEAPTAKARKVCRDARAWMRSLFTEPARAGGTADPEDALGRQLVVLYTGAIVGAHMDREESSAATARAMAAELIDGSFRKR